jgi:transcriptional regulator NrdR family protein
MVCIYCSGPTEVANSRHQKRLNQVWRRRLCKVCKATFTTHEKTELEGSVLVRYSEQELIPFSRDRLFISIYESCKHRPAAASNASALTQTIVALLQDHLATGIIEREVIASTARAALERFDKTAATVYGAYHPISKA